jgi:phage-related protein
VGAFAKIPAMARNTFEKLIDIASRIRDTINYMDSKPLLLLSGEIKSPPFSEEARRKAGFLLRMLQRGELLSMPDSRPMPSIGPRCQELRVVDAGAQVTWRVIYRLDSDVVVIADVFVKKTQKTPDEVLWRCKARLKRYDQDRRRI